MGFLSDLFSGIGQSVRKVGSGLEDTVRGIGGGVDDLLHGDFSGVDDRLHSTFSALDDTVNAVPGGWLTALTLGGLGLPNIGGSLGVENEFFKNLINQGAYGGAQAGARGESVGKGAIEGLKGGALVSGLGAGINALGNSAQSFPVSSSGGGTELPRYTPAPDQSPFRAAIPEAFADTPYGSTPDPSIVNPFQAAMSGGIPGVSREQPADMDSMASDIGMVPMFQGPQQNVPAPDMSSTPMGQWFDSDVGKKFKNILGSTGKFASNNAENLAKLGLSAYSYSRANKAYKDQLGTLAGLFGPTGQYAQNMRSQLERKDAAAGRRSQYGPREADLAGLLAGNASKLAPSMAALQTGQMQNRNAMLAQALNSFGKMGGYKGLQDIFG